MSTLTKNDIIRQVYIHLEISRDDPHEIVDSVLETIKLALEQGEVVKLPGFGNFGVREKTLAVVGVRRPVRKLKLKPGLC